MKKLLTNKNFIQKIMISIVAVVLLSFSMPAKSNAGFGGMLLDPLFDLVGTAFDVVTAGLQAFLVDGKFKPGEGSDLLNIFMVDKASIPDEIKASGDYNVYVEADELDKTWTGKSNYFVPNLKYTPDKIFANKIPALDINFINPKTD